jgi:trimeric autotransporter adhesin
MCYQEESQEVLTRQMSAAVARARSSGDANAAASLAPRERRNTARARACRSPRAVRAAAGHRPPTRSGRIAAAHSPWLTTTTSTAAAASACLPACAAGGGGRRTWHGSQTLIPGPASRRGVPAAEGCGESGESAARHGSTSGSCSSTLDADAAGGTRTGAGSSAGRRGAGGPAEEGAAAAEGSSSSSSSPPAVETEEWEECAEPIAAGRARSDEVGTRASWGDSEDDGERVSGLAGL